MTFLRGSSQPHDIGHAVEPLRSRYVLGVFLGADMMMYGAGPLGFSLFLRRRFRPFV
jgi:hypothetical protein